MKKLVRLAWYPSAASANDPAEHDLLGAWILTSMYHLSNYTHSKYPQQWSEEPEYIMLYIVLYVIFWHPKRSIFSLRWPATQGRGLVQLGSQLKHAAGLPQDTVLGSERDMGMGQYL